MYSYSYRSKSNGAPILSRVEIEDITEGILKEYQEELLTQPQEIDIEHLAFNYLHAHEDIQYLSPNGIYLGATFYKKSNIVTYIPETGKAGLVEVQPRTIVIDSRLGESGQEHRYRFTFGHEVAHLALPHEDYFCRHPIQLAARSGGAIACRDVGGRLAGSDTSKWDDVDWMEWQADSFSSAILMPKKAVRILMNEIEREYEDDGRGWRNYIKIQRMIEIFNISDEAAEIRLKYLGMLDAVFDDSLEEADANEKEPLTGYTRHRSRKYYTAKKIGERLGIWN